MFINVCTLLYVTYIEYLCPELFRVVIMFKLSILCPVLQFKLSCLECGALHISMISVIPVLVLEKDFRKLSQELCYLQHLRCLSKMEKSVPAVKSFLFRNK